MNIKVSASEKGNNKGSCLALVEYLNKENEGKEFDGHRHFFTQGEDMVTRAEVQQAIDSNHRKLSKKDAKFYMITVSPSERELQHIKCSERALREYTRRVMNTYAENFKKGLAGEDLVWFAKIEEKRMDRRTKAQKPGLNWHVHVIVSRRDKQQRFKLSPQSNHRKTTNGPVRGGFDRNSFREGCEQAFDNQFHYQRLWKESFLFQNTVKNGSQRDQDRIKSITTIKRPVTLLEGARMLGKVSAVMRSAFAAEESSEFDKKKRLAKEKDDSNDLGL